MRLFVIVCFLTALAVGQEEEEPIDDRYGNLKYLNMDPQFFCGIIDPYDVLFSILWRVKPTTNIEIHGQWINYIKPFAFEQCHEYNCETVKITDTKIYTINADMLDGLDDITAISFFNNTIDTIKNGTFKRLEKLQELDLSYNLLSGLDAEVRKDLNTLRKLHLNGNPIVLEKNGFEGLLKLELLELTGANITSIPNGTFDGLNHLNRLDLSSNNLTSISRSKFEHLGRLEELDLSLNTIFTIENGAFKGLTSLKNLWLNDNQIEILISHNTFKGIDNLENLYLHSNPLLVLDLAVFSYMPKVAIEPGFTIASSDIVQKNFSNLTSVSVICEEAAEYYTPYVCRVMYRVRPVEA